MRRKRQRQRPLSGLWPDHRLARELRAVSKILDDNPSILELVLHDLCDTGSSGQGAPGLSAEQVLRSAILKNWHQLSYTKLAFLLSDSQSFRRFARLPYHWSVGPIARDWNGAARFEPMPPPWKVTFPIRPIPSCCPTRFGSSREPFAGWPDVTRSSCTITGSAPSGVV